MAGALERDRQLALVAGAGAGLAPRLDLGPLGQVAAEAVDLLVVDLDGLVGTERADLAAASVAVVVVALLGACEVASVGSPRVAGAAAPAIGRSASEGRSSRSCRRGAAGSTGRRRAGRCRAGRGGRRRTPPRRRRKPGRPRRRAAAGRAAITCVGDELGRVALLAVLVLLLAGLEAALDEDLAPLRRYSAVRSRERAPGHDAEPLGLLLPLAVCWSL